MKSIIIPAWNAGELIDECLNSIISQLTAADEVIVVDNGSRDGTPERIAAQYPHITLVRLPENLGFAGGVNRGLQLARGTELILINQDVVLRPNCLAALSAQLATGPAIVGCKLLYPDGLTIQHAGGLIRQPRALADHYGYRQADDGRWDTATEVDYVTGAVFAFNRTVLNAIGWFDEAFHPAYYEEVDYCYRARTAGARVVYEPAAVAIHHESHSTDKRTTAYYRTMERGRVRFALKNLDVAYLLEEFLPAESAYLQQADAAYARDVCAAAYDDVLMNLPPLPPEHAPRLTQALRQLRRTARRRAAPEVSMLDPLPPFEVPALREHEFQSAVPVVGPLIVRLRRLLYALTAKWPLRVALDQQTRINQLLVQRLQQQDLLLRELTEQLIDLDHDLAHLSRLTAEIELRQRQLARPQTPPQS